MVDRNAALIGDADIIVCPLGRAGQPQHRIAEFQQPAGRGMEYLLVECVADLEPARAAPDRQRHPFADHRHMPGAEDRPRSFFEAAKVGRHLLRVVIGAGPIWAGNQDQHHFTSDF